MRVSMQKLMGGGPPKIFLLLAFVGGAAGSATREAANLLIPPSHGVPFSTLTVNIVGAFLLGALLTALLRRGRTTELRARVGALLGTGFLGGFTTYSALANESVGLLRDGAVEVAMGYALGTVILGAAATVAGIAAAGALGPRTDDSPGDPV